MSMWDYNQLFEQQDRGGNPRQGIWKYTKWADPFKNGVKRWNQISCEGEELIDIEMWFPFAGSYFWTQFVPNPTEIIRKSILGGYRCGFYLGTRSKSPLDIIWRNGQASRFLAKVARIPVTTVFYAWGIQTIWEGLSTWQSLIYAGHSCEGDENTCITADGSGLINQDDGGQGAMPLGIDVFDPNNWHEGLGAPIAIPANSHTTCRVYMRGISVGYTCNGFRADLIKNEGLNEIIVDSFTNEWSPGDIENWVLEGVGFNTGNGHWSVRLQWDSGSKAAPLSRLNLTCQRAVVRNTPFELPSECDVWIPGQLDSVTPL